MLDYSKIVLISDLDGTLINSKKEVDQENIDAVDFLIEQGGSFAIATGRNIHNSRYFIQNIRLNGPCITCNGSAIYDSATNEIIQYHQVKKEKTILPIKQILEQLPIVVVEMFSKEKMHVVSDGSGCDPHMESENQLHEYISLEKTLEKEWLKVVFCEDNRYLLEANEILQKADLSDDVDIVFSMPNYLEIMPKGINKGTAIDEIRSMDKYKDKIIVAVGDFDNDIEMLAKADLGIAMGNGSDGAKQAAKLVTVDHDHHPMKEIIHNILPQYFG